MPRFPLLVSRSLIALSKPSFRGYGRHRSVAHHFSNASFRRHFRLVLKGRHERRLWIFVMLSMGVLDNSSSMYAIVLKHSK